MLNIRLAHDSVHEPHAMGSLGYTSIAKTPARPLITNHSRMLLKENAVEKQTVKGKRIAYPNTPAHGIQKLDSVSKPLAPAAPKLIALVDKTNKTPFRSRLYNPMTPLASGKQPSTSFSPMKAIPEPGTVIRPSAARKSIRLPQSASRSFETPEREGRKPFWEISDGDITVDLGPSELVPDGLVVEEEDDDEIEYTTPAVPDEVYDPGFEMPNYISLGRSLILFSAHRWIDDFVMGHPLLPDGLYNELLVSSRNFQRIDIDDPFLKHESTAEDQSRCSKAKPTKAITTNGKVARRTAPSTAPRSDARLPPKTHEKSRNTSSVLSSRRPTRTASTATKPFYTGTCGDDQIILGSCSEDDNLHADFLFQIERGK
ncbi:hypothetical protein FRC03_001613 [Tulasnella sp. 419]|nr:hypothetical protein FRC03_001613 [Tulasnella sp. 419]